MLRAGLLIGSCAVGAAACAPVTGGAPDPGARQAAERQIALSIRSRFPDYPEAEQAAACVGANATDQEILILAGERGRRPAADLNRLGFAIAARPDTRACLNSNNVPPLG